VKTAVCVCPLDCAFGGSNAGEHANGGNDRGDDCGGMHVDEVGEVESRFENRLSEVVRKVKEWLLEMMVL
jgi:hypothetical protein